MPSTRQLSRGSDSHTPSAERLACGHSQAGQVDAESSVTALPAILRLLTMLDGILQETEAEELREGLKSALCGQSLSELLRIKTFADSLCRTCEHLCEASSQPVADAGIGVEEARDIEEHNLETQDIETCNIEAHDGLVDQSGEVPGSNVLAAGRSKDLEASRLQTTNGRGVQPTHIEELNEADGGLSTPCTAASEAETTSADCSAGLVAPSVHSRVADTVVASSHWRAANGRAPQPAHVEEGDDMSGRQRTPCTAALEAETTSYPVDEERDDTTGRPATPCTAALQAETTSHPVNEESDDTNGRLASPCTAAEAQTPSAAKVRGLQPTEERGKLSKHPNRPPTPDLTVDYEQGCSSGLEQSIDDFIMESDESVRQFSDSGTSPETYKALLESLRHVPEEGKLQWSDGSEWASFVEAEHCERLKSSFRYVLTTIAFSRWHTAQAQLLDMPAKKASEAVTRRVLGLKPQDAPRSWEKRRKRLSNHLSRGRKWSLMVAELGFGILFGPWKVASFTISELQKLLKGLPKEPKKMTVLRLLDDQVQLLLVTGKTDHGKFRDDLKNEDLLVSVPDPISATECAELDTFADRVRSISTGDELYVASSHFKFSLASLATLGGETWLNDEAILACLHLSDKLPFVRVGFCIPIHQQVRPNSAMPRPFERAGLQIKQWQSEMEVRTDTVSFFPISQHGNHFSLLEINEREGFIYHYDSMFKGENAIIKAACDKEFPQFHYFEKRGLQQRDGHSCGPITIRHARWRMLGREVYSKTLDRGSVRALRYEALGVLQSAWENGEVTAAPKKLATKRRGPPDREDLSKNGKRQKLHRSIL